MVTHTQNAHIDIAYPFTIACWAGSAPARLVSVGVLIGFLLALGCSLCYGTATVLQAAGTRSVEAGSGSGVDAVLLLRAVRQWRYLVGIGLDVVGFLLQVAALRLVPIYVVAAALAASIAVTGVVAAWLLSARLSRVEWCAVGVVCASLVALAVAAGPGHFRHAPAGLGWALLGVVAAVLIAGFAAGRLPDRARALALGLGAGTGFGVVEVGVRLIDVIDPTTRSFYTNPPCTRRPRVAPPDFCCSPRLCIADP